MQRITLSLLVLKTGRLQECLQFYSTLGLTFNEERHGAGPLHYSCSLGEIVLELYPFHSDDSQAKEARSEIMLGFNVTGLSGTLDLLQDMNVAVKKLPHETERGRRAVVLDPDGRAIELVECLTSKDNE